MTPDIQKLPPHSLDAERAVLGCCLLDPRKIDEVTEKLNPKAFYDTRTRQIFEAISAMHHEGKPIEVGSLFQQLADQKREIPLDFTVTLPDTVPSAENVGHYVEIVRSKWLLRRLINVCSTAIDRAHSDAVPEALIGQVETAVASIPTDDSCTYDNIEMSDRLLKTMESRFDMHNKGQHSGLLTGFWGFDRYTDGLQFGEMAIIAARPSIGKTALALNIVDKICFTDEVPTVFVTYEMSAEALIRRLFAAHQSVHMKTIRTGALTERDMMALGTFHSIVKKRPLHIVDAVSGLDANQLCAKLRRLVRKHGIKLVVVDYLQKIKAPRSHEKRTYEVAQASEIVKAFAVHSGVALLMLAQMNRESEKERGKGPPRLPRLTDIGDSGAIERDGDTIGLLHRERDKSETVLFIAKQRDGELGTVHLNFVGKHGRFENPPKVETE